MASAVPAVTMTKPISSRREYQCKRCNHQTSLTAYSIFYKIRKPLRDWFWAIFLVATRTTGSFACQLQYDLGISYPTGWSWYHWIRKAMKGQDTRYTLRGIIEPDDTYIGGKRKPLKRGRGTRSRVPVLRAVESQHKGCGHVALRKVTSVTPFQARGFLTHTVAGFPDPVRPSVGISILIPGSQSPSLDHRKCTAGSEDLSGLSSGD